MDRFIELAMAGAEAITHASWQTDNQDKQERTTTIIGSDIGGFPSIAHAVRTTRAGSTSECSCDCNIGR